MTHIYDSFYRFNKKFIFRVSFFLKWEMSNNFESIWTNSARLKRILKINSKTFPVSISELVTNYDSSLVLATLETVLVKIASNGEMPFDFEWKQISQLVKRKILFCIDSMNTKV